MKLEAQLDKLSELGIYLNEGITIDNLLGIYERRDYEKNPFDLIFYALGSDVEKKDGKYHPVSSQVWDFDFEYVNNDGDYTDIVKRLCTLSGDPSYLYEVSDDFNSTTQNAWLRYTVNGKKRNCDIRVSDDWADETVIKNVMLDLERDGRKFYYKDNGQAMTLFYLNEDQAGKLNMLARGGIGPALAKLEGDIAFNGLLERFGINPVVYVFVLIVIATVVSVGIIMSAMLGLENLFKEL